MDKPDRHTICTVVNDLIDALLDEGVGTETIRNLLGYTSESDRDYLDIDWLFEMD